MKKITFKWLNGIILPLFLLPFIPSFAQCLPSIGSAATFSVFTNSGGIDNVAASTIDGTIGTNFGTITGFETSAVSGGFHIADSQTNSAATDLSTAYTAFQNMPATVTNHTPAFGSGETLFSGVYSSSAAGSVAGTLILDAQNNPSAKFVFKFGGAFTTGAGVTIVLINGAQANSVYWIVEGAFSLAANITFKGTTIANGAISIGVGAQIHGKLLSISGAISTYGTNLSIDGIDNATLLYYADLDLDGYGDAATATCYYATGYVTNGTDCDDTSATINPGAAEIYGNGIDDNCNGVTDADAIVCTSTTTWNGNDWSNGIPTYTKEAVFSGNFTSTADVYACTIRVTNSATVVSTHDVFVYGSITVENGSSYTQMNNSNLIQIDPLAVNVGAISVKRNTSTLVRLDHTLWASPVVGQNLYGFSPQTLTHRFYTYNTPTDTYLSSTLSSSSVFEVAKGYVVRAPNNQSSLVPAEWTGTFFGVPTNGSYSFNLAYSPTFSYNLVGNPYPSTIDAAKFVSDNAATIEGTLYFYAHTLSMDSNGQFQAGTNYATWNATGATAATEIALNDPAYHTPAEIPDGSIQVGQGFFVKAKSSGNVNFTNELRRNNQDNQFFRTTNEKHRIWLDLKLENGTPINQLLIGYVWGATDIVDSQFDGRSFGNTGSYLYSVIENKDYVIQGRALPFDINDSVPLGFVSSTAGTYAISLCQFDGIFANQLIYIKDNLTGATVAITDAPYIFTSAEGVFNSRFEVVYLPNLTTNTTNLDGNSVQVFNKNEQLHIASKKQLIEKVQVYDVMGRLLFAGNNYHQQTVDLENIPNRNQVLILKIEMENNQWITLQTIY
jgi:hypothetical protein